MDTPTLIIITLLSIGITLLLLRWALSISLIVGLLREQRDLLAKMADPGSKKSDPNLSTIPSTGVASVDSHIATQLHDLKKKYISGDLSETEYQAEVAILKDYVKKGNWILK